MADTLTDLAEFDLPYRRKATLKRIDFESGLSMVRLVLREGKRITQIDLDADSAKGLADAMNAAADDL
ncbi:hypothetical protein [Aliiroseovarius sp.]|uniref:DUF6967 family protein n=1 Tax=Aliiroseovarius sp. TaxID=1872442 RepID=UPI00262736E8|nr:hypothetical protein [Aliiroseovarius sp.]